MFGNKRVEETFSVERFKTLIDSTTTIDGRMNFGDSVRIVQIQHRPQGGLGQS